MHQLDEQPYERSDAGRIARGLMLLVLGSPRRCSSATRWPNT